jgi:hypothetical protein
MAWGGAGVSEANGVLPGGVLVGFVELMKKGPLVSGPCACG